jgi:hypothetical protein
MDNFDFDDEIAQQSAHIEAAIPAVVQSIDENMEKIKARMADNLKKEAEEIDPRLMFLKLKKAFMEQYGRISAANTLADYAIGMCNSIKNEMYSDRELLRQTVRLLYEHIEQSTPWYKKLYNKLFRK